MLALCSPIAERFFIEKRVKISGSLSMPSVTTSDGVLSMPTLEVLSEASTKLMLRDLSVRAWPSGCIIGSPRNCEERRLGGFEEKEIASSPWSFEVRRRPSAAARRLARPFWSLAGAGVILNVSGGVWVGVCNWLVAETCSRRR